LYLRIDAGEFRQIIKQVSRWSFNKVNNVVIFLKAFGITRLLKKSEYPRYMPKSVVYYDATQVGAMYAAVLDDEERLTLDYFLKTGVRDGEAAHAEYADIRDASSRIGGTDSVPPGKPLLS